MSYSRLFGRGRDAIELLLQRITFTQSLIDYKVMFPLLISDSLPTGMLRTAWSQTCQFRQVSERKNSIKLK